MSRHSLLGLVVCLLLWPASTGAQQLGVRTPRVGSFHPLDTEVRPGAPLLGEVGLLTMNTRLVKQQQEIDFEKREITFKHVDDLGVVIWQYRYVELDDYLRSRQAFVLADLWYKNVSEPKSSTQDQRNKPLALEFALPVQYPSWAQRIVGKEPPRLSIHGYEEIVFKIQHSNREEENVNFGNQSGNTAPLFENNYSLTVEGSVGRLINISMKTTSEEDFAFENPLKDIKLQYRGEGNELEDDIIQEVTAGYTGFSLSGTSLSGYSENREGLFGISIKSKFGPLTLTTIASMEQGEPIKLVKDMTGSTSEKAQTRNEKQFADPTPMYRFFFLDTLYRRAYNQNYSPNSQPMRVPRVPASALQVWRSVESERRGDIHSDAPGIFGRDRSDTTRLFRRMDRGWTLNSSEGWIQFHDSVIIDANTIIGIAFQSEDPNVARGSARVIDSAGSPRLPVLEGLFMLKPHGDLTDTSLLQYKLVWRNVYRFDPVDGNFDLTVLRVKEGGGDGDSAATAPSGKLYSYILGLTDEGGKIIQSNNIFRMESGYLILPPYSGDFWGNEPFRNPALGADNTNPGIYDNPHTLAAFLRDIRSKYVIKIIGRHTSRETTMDLGWGVIPNTERLVTQNGTLLKRDEDYRIDYGSGNVQLTSFTATSAQRITAEYERESLFIPDRKSFLGARGEIKLPWISETSLLGMSVLYQHTSTRDRIPQFGSVPFNKLLLGINTRIDFEPEWMTALVNRIPLITTDAKSKVTIDLEAAHSRAKPSMESGGAYVDDFERSKQSYSLPMSTTGWYQASPPMGPSEDSILLRPPIREFYWFRPEATDPRHRVLRDSIVHDTIRFRGLQASERAAEVLRLECIPAGAALRERYRNPWAGIMTPIYEKDRSRDKYFEFYVKAEQASGLGRGVLYIDMGQVSEDLCEQGKQPNGFLNEEDSAGLGWTQFNRGLDGIAENEKEVWYVPNKDGNGWDTLRFKSPLLSDSLDPSRDDWANYNHSNLGNFRKANGTQNDPYRLQSEDINRDGFSKTESYFRFRVNLDSLATSPYNLTNSTARNDLGWYRIRIPLSSYRDSVNGPSWQQIRYVRLWWSDFGDNQSLSSKRVLQFSEMEFVGNEWEERKLPVSDTIFDGIQRFINPNGPDSLSPLRAIHDRKIDASVVNTEEDPDYQEKQKLLGDEYIYRERDPSFRREKVYKKEQALRLRYWSLRPGEEAIVRKQYIYQAMDFSAYKTISLLVHGSETVEQDSVDFVFRIGTNDSSYYEFRTPLRKGWNVDRFWNEPIEIDLTFMARQKLELLSRNDTTRSRIITDPVSAPGSNRSTYRVSFVRNSPPNFAKVSTLMFGFVRRGGDKYSSSGEIWVNEMKVRGLSGFNGSAAIAKISTAWADFMTVDGSVDYRDGNFRTMTDNRINPANSRVTAGVNGTLGLDKFLPREWGVNIPVSASANVSVERPQIVPNSDIPLKDDGKPDNLKQILGLEDSKAKFYEQEMQTQSIRTQYRKSRQSDNALVNLTLDRIAVEELSANFTQSSRGRGARDSTDESYKETDTNQTYATVLTYDLSPKKQNKWAKWRPFEKTSLTWFPSEFKEYELNLLPKRFNFKLADMRYSSSKYTNDIPGLEYLSREDRKMTLGHEFSMSYTPIAPLLDLDYSLSVDRNFDRDVRREQVDGGFVRHRVFARDAALSKYGLLYGEDRRIQTAKGSLSPRFVNWLTHTVDYSVRYSGEPKRPNDSTTYLGIDLSTTFDFRSSISFSRLLGELSKATDSVQAIGSFFDIMKQGVDGISLSDIRFNYSGNLTMRNRNLHTKYLDSVETWDMVRYQFGKYARTPWDMVTGDMNDYSRFGVYGRQARGDWPGDVREDLRETRRTWRVETGLRIPEPIDINVQSLSLDYAKSYAISSDARSLDTSVTFPSVGVNVSSEFLNKIALVREYFTTMSFSSGYTYKRTLTWKTELGLQGSRLSDTTWERSHSFLPLFGTGGSFKALPVTFTYDHNYTRSSTSNTSTGNETADQEHSDNVRLSYTIERKGSVRELKLLGWTIPLTGNIETSLNGRHRHNVSEGSGRENPRGNVTKDIREFEFEPEARYVFTDKVSGRTSFLFQRRHFLKPRVRTETDAVFSLGVRITF